MLHSTEGQAGIIVQVASGTSGRALLRWGWMCGCYLGSEGTVLGADVRFWESKALSQGF